MARMAESDRVRYTKRAQVMLRNMLRNDGLLCCEWCDCQIFNGSFQVDHVVARAAGGDAKALDNCVISCAVCNAVKNSKDAAMVFGHERFARVTAEVKNCTLVHDVYSQALAIYKAGKNWQERARLAEAYVLFGVLPA